MQVADVAIYNQGVEKKSTVSRWELRYLKWLQDKNDY